MKNILTIPNLLTVLRFILVPLFLFCFLSDRMALQILGTFLFILAALTDHYDGRIARRYRQVTQFGKFADPLADKLLTLAGFVAIVLRDEFAAVAVYLAVMVGIIAVREIGITVLRIWAIMRETPVITSMWGKVKTTAQLFTIIFTLVILNFRQITLKVPESATYYPGDQVVTYVVNALIFICMIITVISGILYLSRNRLEPNNSAA
ncbi:CDP-diacylglycerol--glycerol-3-phosphate 3-phosphatidyltransferase [candidate division LCP-89 bacterium B3_LCP]|uniref:CDP-diacylglycerol--glycerol-3-phosphate 3-phosphatidyltransferase n=1 Tax=candidate division LCP-89 bacterium B3_LCP TaxID=2012998 RepID=A0A532V597_UNCL8|nr:MAG: CDP-diacylglycerol--glycerol-3-phosphate 3-phosphatidyltransferase [candidate division LCP-89 bacterium B3_LCP]